MKLNSNKNLQIIFVLYLYLGILNALNSKEKSKAISVSNGNLSKASSTSVSKSSSKSVILNISTPDEDWGESSVFYLDRHNVDCSHGKALQGFQLFRPQTHSLKYAYACKDSIAIKGDETYQDQTQLDITGDDEKNSAHFLDRHAVKCREKYALQQFKLERDTNNRKLIQYKFRCVKVNCEDERSFQTIESDADNYGTIFLDRQKIELEENRVIIGFKLNSRYENGGWFSKDKCFYKYTVTHCKLKEEKEKILPPPVNKGNLAVLNKETTPNDWGEGSIFYLDRHKVDCGVGSALQGFALQNLNQNKILYKFACKSSPLIKAESVYDEKTVDNDTNENDRASIHYLDRHQILCHDGHALQSFKLERSPGDPKKIYYSFKCIKVINCVDKKTNDTQETDGGDKLNIYLDRQIIQLEENTVLIGFKLNSRFEGNKAFLRYTITTCRLDDFNNKNNNNLPNNNPNPNSNNTGNNPNTNPNSGANNNPPDSEKNRNNNIPNGQGNQQPQPNNNNPGSNTNPNSNPNLNPNVNPNNLPVTPPKPVPNGELCFDITPEFNGKEKQCADPQNFTCHKKAFAPEGDKKKYCLAYNPELNPIIIPSNEPNKHRNFKQGEVCFSPAPEFKQGEKPCEENLICRYENLTAINPPETPKKCLPKDMPKIDDKLLKLGETCFNSTPEFNGIQKKCESGLICQYEEQKPLSGAPMKCMKKGEPLPIPQDENKQKGINFCSQNCIEDNVAREKKCYDNVMFKCRGCTVRPTIGDTERNEINLLCRAICNSKLNEHKCEFYGYLNNRRKDINPNLLSKYKIVVYRR